jgi:hypothetical protein
MACLEQVKRTGISCNIKKVKGKLYSAGVQCVVTHGSDTWPARVEDMRRLERAEKMMITRMCGVTLRNGKTSEISNRLGIMISERV